MNDTLLANQRELAGRLAQGGAHLPGAEAARIAELEEQVRDLMVFIEAQGAVQSAAAAPEELRDGDVLKLRGMPTAGGDKGRAAREALAARLSAAKDGRRRK